MSLKDVAAIEADEWELCVPFSNKEMIHGVDIPIAKEVFIKRLTDRELNGKYSLTVDVLFHDENFIGKKAITIMRVYGKANMSQEDVDRELSKVSGLY